MLACWTISAVYWQCSHACSILIQLLVRIVLCGFEWRHRSKHIHCAVYGQLAESCGMITFWSVKLRGMLAQASAFAGTGVSLCVLDAVSGCTTWKIAVLRISDSSSLPWMPMSEMTGIV